MHPSYLESTKNSTQWPFSLAHKSALEKHKKLGKATLEKHVDLISNWLIQVTMLCLLLGICGFQRKGIHVFVVLFKWGLDVWWNVTHFLGLRSSSFLCFMRVNLCKSLIILARILELPNHHWLEFLCYSSIRSGPQTFHAS
jgi:hypothetical protein